MPLSRLEPAGNAARLPLCIDLPLCIEQSVLRREFYPETENVVSAGSAIEEHEQNREKDDEEVRN
jgi:hypothetical protein